MGESAINELQYQEERREHLEERQGEEGKAEGEAGEGRVLPCDRVSPEGSQGCTEFLMRKKTANKSQSYSWE